MAPIFACVRAVSFWWCLGKSACSLFRLQVFPQDFEGSPGFPSFTGCFTWNSDFELTPGWPCKHLQKWKEVTSCLAFPQTKQKTKSAEVERPSDGRPRLHETRAQVSEATPTDDQLPPWHFQPPDFIRCVAKKIKTCLAHLNSSAMTSNRMPGETTVSELGENTQIPHRLYCD